MNHIRTMLTLTLTFSASLCYGQQTPNTTAHDTRTHAIRGDGQHEGPLRYAPLSDRSARLDLNDAIPLPEPTTTPDFDFGDPSFADREAITLDARTGLEMTSKMSDFGFSDSQWIEGSLQGNGDEGDLIHGDSWNSDLSSISSSSFPWSTQCRIYFESSNGTRYVCSGTLLDPRHVLTAGHCVHEGNGGNWYTNFRIFPAWDGDDDAFGGANWTSATTFGGWANDGNWNDDMAVIRLDRPVGFLSEWLGYGFSTNDSFYEDNLFNLAGYPGSCYSGAPHQLYYGWGSYDDITDYRLKADVAWSCPSAGMSGAGSYIIGSGGFRYMIGVHSTRCMICDPDRIGHTRMTQGKFNYIATDYVPRGYSDTQPDFVPLDVNVTAAGGTVSAGEQLSSFNYLIGNASRYNPPSGTINVSVYLSSNDNISTSDTLIQTHSLSYNFGALTDVRVTAPPPTIPSDTPSGNYWIGVIISGSNDVNTGNDDTDGWDAAPITVEGCRVDMTPFGEGLAGSGGFVPTLNGVGSSCSQGGHVIQVEDGLGGTSGVLWVGVGTSDLSPGWGGHFYIDLSRAWTLVPIRLGGTLGQPGAGFLDRPGSDKGGQQGLRIYLQALFLDPGAQANVSMTNALEFQVQ